MCLVPYPVPKLNGEIFKKEVERLSLLGVAEEQTTQNREPHTSHNRI